MSGTPAGDPESRALICCRLALPYYDDDDDDDDEDDDDERGREGGSERANATPLKRASLGTQDSLSRSLALFS